MPPFSDSSGNYNSDAFKQSLGELLGLARGLLDFPPGGRRRLDCFLFRKHASVSEQNVTGIHSCLIEPLAKL